MNSSSPKNILLTIDVEDWFQVENLRTWFPPETWDSQELRVEKNTHDLLDLLDSIELQSYPTNPKSPRATFFVLGWIAERLPSLVREIQTRGHEVASHGYNHLMCNQMDEIGLKEDLVRSKKTIEDIVGGSVSGYRAPNFSINETALRLIEDSGYRYDSSYNNFSKHGRYGTISLNGHKKAGAALLISRDFAELPISNLAIGKQVIPWGGGGYFRLLPPSIFKAGVKSILKKSTTYMFYMHPWEIDPHQPRPKKAKGLSAWRHYLNLEKTRQRLRNLIKAFKYSEFQTCSEYLEQAGRFIT